jgi:F-type H+-transporting ATPase subunit delta
MSWPGRGSVARGDLIEGYAQSLFSAAEAEGALEDVESELFHFVRTLERRSDLREALGDIALPPERKRALLEELLKDKANPATLNLLSFVIEQGRARELGSIVERLVELAAERRERAVAEVRTAVPLTKEREQKLAAALGKATGKRVELRVIVDPNVVGGVVARVGDQVFDGSIRRKLELAKQHVAQT